MNYLNISLSSFNPSQTYEELKACFTLSTIDACKKLKITECKLRAQLKHYGIIWPYTLILELTTNINRINKILDKVICTNAEKEWLAELLTRQTEGLEIAKERPTTTALAEKD